MSAATGENSMRAKTSLAFASMLMGAVAALASPADAACKKFGFTVNDYGKDGPTNDAKNLLDKHITEWAAQNGVSDYSTGKKTVSCELFLDVILFDEHTCTASATVCWGPDAKKLGAQSATAPESDSTGAAAPPAPVRKAHAMGHATEQAAAAPAAPAAEAASAAAAAPMEAAPTSPVEQIAAPAEMPAAAPAVHTAPQAQDAAGAAGTTGAVVETGALQAGQGLPPPSSKPAKSAVPEKDRAAAAAAAASAAAAAERAAVAAETAANAAKEAAAAAVAASAASKSSATVPPLNHASGAAPAHAE